MTLSHVMVKRKFSTLCTPSSNLQVAVVNNTFPSSAFHPKTNIVPKQILSFLSSWYMLKPQDWLLGWAEEMVRSAGCVHCDVSSNQVDVDGAIYRISKNTRESQYLPVWREQWLQRQRIWLSTAYFFVDSLLPPRSWHLQSWQNWLQLWLCCRISWKIKYT